jgi:hypothetical protein
MRKACYLLPVFLLLASALHAQETWGGEIESVEFEIVKERQLSLPRANRPFEKIPPRPIEPIEPRLTYDFRPTAFEGPSFKPALRPFRLKPEELPKLFGRSISAGLGNYQSPYIEATISTKRDKTRFMSANFFHRSFGVGPVDGPNSAEGNTSLSLLARSAGQKVQAGGELVYAHHAFNFYGFPDIAANRNLLPQHFNRIRLSGQLANVRTGHISYQASGWFAYMEDRLKAAESEVNLNAAASYRMSDNSVFTLHTDYFIIARRDAEVDARPRHLARVRPAYRFEPRRDLELEAGAQFAFENDTVGGGRNLHVYPHARATYNLATRVEATAWLTGNIERVNLHTLTAENPWLAANVPIFHTNKRIEAGGALKGGGRGLNWQAGISTAALDHRYFFVNDVSQARFMLQYFPEVVWRTNPFAEVGWSRELKAGIKARFDYFRYTSQSAGFVPWHLPLYRFETNATLNLHKKVALQSGVLALGGIQAPDVVSLGTVALPTAVDVNLKADYLFSNRFVVFLKGENLLNNSYRLYFNYPVRSLQVLAGATYNF